MNEQAFLIENHDRRRVQKFWTMRVK